MEIFNIGGKIKCLNWFERKSVKLRKVREYFINPKI